MSALETSIQSHAIAGAIERERTENSDSSNSLLISGPYVVHFAVRRAELPRLRVARAKRVGDHSEIASGYLSRHPRREAGDSSLFRFPLGSPWRCFLGCAFF